MSNELNEWIATKLMGLEHVCKGDRIEMGFDGLEWQPRTNGDTLIYSMDGDDGALAEWEPVPNYSGTYFGMGAVIAAMRERKESPNGAGYVMGVEQLTNSDDWEAHVAPRRSAEPWVIETRGSTAPLAVALAAKAAIESETK